MGKATVTGNEIKVEITVGDALSALEAHIQAATMWRTNAIQLLEMVGHGTIDDDGLRKTCAEHAEKGLAL